MHSYLKQGLLLSALLIFIGISALLDYDDGIVWRGVYIPAWTAWPKLIIAILLGAFTIRKIFLGQWRKKMDYTPEELNQTRKVLDQICKTDTAKQQEPGETENKEE